MRNISYWAARNKAVARIIIFLGYVCLLGSAWHTAPDIYRSGFRFGLEGIAVITIICFGIALAYPQKRFYAGNMGIYLKKRFWADLTLYIAGMVMGMAVLNYEMEQAMAEGNSASGWSAVPVALYHGQMDAAGTTGIDLAKGKQESGQWRKNIRNWIKEHYLQNQEEKKNLGGYYFLIFAMVLILFPLLAALSCSISCSGLEALGLITLFVGLGGLFLLSVFLLKKLLPEDKKRRAYGIALLYLIFAPIIWAIVGSVAN